MSRAITCAGVYVGHLLRTSAATPATIGDENDVPERPITYGSNPAGVFERGAVLVMLKPGAAMSTVSPYVLKLVSAPYQLVAPTDSTSEYAAGYWGTEAPVLPAAATSTTPLATAFWIAVCRTGLSPPPASDMLITRAPFFTAQLMPLMTLASLPSPLSSSTFTGRTLAFHATPAIPIELPVPAAMMPVTAVPCPSPSFGASAVLKVL
ncbi:hypothetical protein GCM10009742_40110 [Kribbella karoonensis]|uniref:Uncharacterized protein n=1 Tax=Kribbella karoonensis TaxID=324851 RepID=A0ABN2DXB3_9ACTN